MNSAIEIKNLSKKYDNFELKNISFNVPNGTIVGFVGENGAGKTTTIKSILNLINIDNGNIKIFNKDYKKYESIIKNDIGVVLDNSFFCDQLTSDDINKIMNSMYDKWDSNKYIDYLNKFKLPLNKCIKEYSSGMLMKLKIITALSHNPKLLILDEPTSGLDPIARSEILDLFQEFIESDEHSILVSSHITSDLEHIADYIIFINEGEIILNEEKDKLLYDYRIVKCSKEELEKIDKKDIIKYKVNKYECDILINNIDKFKKKYNFGIIDKATIDDIMLLYIKGV